MPTDKLLTALVDDHPIVIEGLKMLLQNENNLQIVGGFCTGADILSYLKINQVDLVLLDISLPDMNGLELCRLIKRQSVHTIILMLSNRTERSIILQSIQNGASGYLLKNSSLEELRYCIYEALQGKIAYSKEVNEIISHPSANELRGIPKLTRREKQILQLIAEGKTSQTIAEELFLSPLTVDTHRKNLLQKFEVKNMVELIMVATQHSLL